MRWDAQGIDRADPQALPGLELPRRIPGLLRSVRTPRFAGLTFHEVRARSIINQVPAASRVPFRWTVNPYRGCSHACVYCMAGDTAVLLADGGTRPLAELRAGDRVYGTVRRGSHRHLVATEVRAHWETVTAGYRVRLADGTALVAGGDHRFLTSRGWAYVTGSGVGRRRRRLTTDDELVAVLGEPRRRVVSITALGVELPMYDLTTGTGDFVANGVVSHNCFARKTHTYLDLDAGRDFDSQVVVKVNVPELLRRELAAPRWAGEPIAMGTNVDCYQRAEGRYALMPGIIEALRDAANPFSILTKGTLILRDLPLLRQAAAVTEVGLSVSVGSVDRELWRLAEPGTPSPPARLRVVSTLAAAGLGCGVLMAPILPFLSDRPEQLAATVEALARAGARSVSPLVLHLRPGAREWYLDWLRRHRPDLLPRYRELYGDRAYAPRDYQRQIAEQVAELARRFGMGRRDSRRRDSGRRVDDPRGRAGPAGAGRLGSSEPATQLMIPGSPA